MQRFSSLILPAIAAVLLTACSASEDYMPPVYSCDCGTLVLDGDSLQVLGAEFVYLQQEDSLFSRRYFVTADAQAEGESEEHGVSLILDVPNVQQGAVFYPADLRYGRENPKALPCNLLKKASRTRCRSSRSTSNLLQGTRSFFGQTIKKYYLT